MASEARRGGQVGDVERFRPSAMLARIPVASSVAAAIGFAAWGDRDIQLALAPFAVALWATRPSRTQAWTAMGAYYLAAARGLPFGATSFFGDGSPVVFSVALWVGASLLLSVPWALCWGQAGFWWRVPLALVAVVLPPIGIVGWANPLVAAGTLFPGWGWWGLAAMVTVTILVCYWPLRAGCLVVVAAVVGSMAPLAPASHAFRSVDTDFGGSGNRGRDYMRDYLANLDMVDLAVKSTAPYLVYPEGVAGVWNESTTAIWRQASNTLGREGRTVLIGAEVPIAGGDRTRNALVMVGALQGVVPQRIPVPVSMWRPWSAEGSESDIWGNGLVQLPQGTAAVFICYEQLLMWPLLRSQWEGPSMLIGASNVYWASGTSIPGIQATNMRAWGRLFDIPVILAVNR